MTSARRVISVKKEVVGKNIVARVDGVTAADLNFMNTDGVNVSFHLRNSDFFVFDQDLNLVAQRRHEDLSGSSRAKGQVYSPTTLLGGSSYAGTVVVTGGEWRHALYKIDGPSLTVPPTPQQLNTGDSGPVAINRLFVQADAGGSSIYTACATNGNDVILLKYDSSLVEQARTYIDADSRFLIGFIRGGTTLYVVHEDINYHLSVLAYDLNLNLLGRVAYTSAATHAGHMCGADFRDGYLYVGTSTRNPTYVQYDLALWKISQDLTSYDVTFIDETTLQGGPAVFGCRALSNGNVVVVGARYNDVTHHLTVLEFDSTTMDLVSQFEDSADIGAAYEDCAATSIGDSVYLAMINATSVHITRLDNRDFPLPVTPSCDGKFTWQNTSLATSKSSGSFSVTTPATPTKTFTPGTPNMSDSATSYSLAAQCEF